jgi:peptide/nickel transport system substrate-binding protein
MKFAGVAFTLALLVSACGGQSSGSADPSTDAPSSGASADPSDGGEQPVDGGSVTAGLTGWSACLHPVLCSVAGEELRHQSLLFEGLLIIGQDEQLEPRLAEEMPTVSEDGLTYTFTLHEGLEWSDGEPLTAEDVAFTYRLHSDPEYEEIASPLRGGMSAVIDSVEATDDRTVVFTLKQPSASFLALYGWRYIVPEHVLGDLSIEEFNENAFGRSPTPSSGAFVFEELVEGSHLALVRNDNYWRGPAHLERYVALDSSHDAIINELKLGNIDLYRATAFARFEEIQGIEGVVLDTYEAPTGIMVYYNLDSGRPTSPIFQSKPVRQALLWAIDRQSTIDAALFGYGSVPVSTAGIYPSYSWAHDPDPNIPYEFNPDLAAELLDEDGWEVGADGVREKDGVRLAFELITSQESAEWQASAQILVEQWAAIGAEATIRIVPYGEISNQVLFNRDFDVAFFQPPFNIYPEADLTPAFHSSNAGEGGSNWTGYQNPEVDAILEEAAQLTDQGERQALYHELQDILNEDVPAWALQYWRIGWVHSERVRGWSVEEGNIGPRANYMFPDAGEAWVVDGE